MAGVLVAQGVAGASPARPIALQPNHQISLKPGGHGGGGSNCPTGTSLGWSSSNWSGYAETCKAPYTGVGGSWEVPSVASSPASSYSAIWLGIDGFNNNSLIQTGTEQDVDSSGHASYAAWWTTSSNQFVEQDISSGCSPSSTNCGTVQANDQITATITQMSASTSQWTIVISDGSEWTFTKTLTYKGPKASAEWIVEAPTVGGRVATLADYGSSLTFNPDTIAAGTINGTSSPLLTTPEGGTMVSGRGRFVATVSIPSAPDNDQDGFNISYGSTAPSPPSS